MERQWTVLEAASELEVSEHTLRYYEKLGLLGQISRSSSGRRSYTSANLDSLRFILRLRAGPEGAVLPKTQGYTHAARANQDLPRVGDFTGATEYGEQARDFAEPSTQYRETS